MSITVFVCGENGDKLTTPMALDWTEDPTHWVSHLIPPPTDLGSPCWRFIDRSGVTTFNRLQIPVFVEEMERLSENATRVQLGRLVEIRALADFAMAIPHRYLRFWGD